MDIQDFEHFIGTPTVYRPEMDKQIEDYLSEGLSIEASVAQIGIGLATLRDWCNPENPEKYKESFARAVKKGIAQGMAFFERIGNQQATGEIKGSTIAWIFNMKNRYNWRDTREIELSGDLNLIALDGVDDESTEVIDAVPHTERIGITPKDADFEEAESAKVSEESDDGS